MIDYSKLYLLADNNKKKYLNNAPFPNIFFDNFFPEDFYNFLLKSFPMEDSGIWKTPSNKFTQHKSVTRQGDLGLKESLFTENQRRSIMEFNSSLFIEFVERLTGINGLIPDPFLAEASFAMSKRDGFLDIHADFSHHDRMNLERRVNVIFYLNDDWHESYNGALKLYDENQLEVKSILPLGNRIAIFTTSDKSYHGFPEKINCPIYIQRRSINMYYYSVPRIERERKRILFPNDKDFVNVITKE